eukprot:1752128-Lingulodinium_polyedra.AAC.1
MQMRPHAPTGNRPKGQRAERAQNGNAFRPDATGKHGQRPQARARGQRPEASGQRPSGRRGVRGNGRW